MDFLPVLIRILAIWELLSRIGVFHELILPAPSLVAVATCGIINVFILLFHFGVTMYETIAGFLIGSFLAIILGIIVSSNVTLI